MNYLKCAKVNTMWVLVMLVSGSALTHGWDRNLTAGDQLPMFRTEHKKPVGIMTVKNGEPIDLSETESVNSELLNNLFFFESLQSLNRERIPERAVHAKGGGAFGYFEVTHDISDICKAKVFRTVGRRTPVAVRFSLLVESIGGSDTYRDNRGFAVKFYTEEGNLDLLAILFETFIIKDPVHFPNLIHAVKKNPKTHLYDANSIWDFLTLRQESINFVMSLFRDMGIPNGYRHMPGFTVHTFQVYNNKGESNYIRFRFEPDAELQSLDTATGIRLAGEDPDYANRDLYEAILNGHFPSWTVAIQHMSAHEIKHADIDPFDVTLKWPVQKYPPQPIGKIVLNRNPSNYFAEIEQMSFIPSNLVPGVLGGVDRLFEARRFGYSDAAVYRLGVNSHRILVNFPLKSGFKTYYRDGHAPVKENFEDVPNYYPNSFNGPMPCHDKARPQLIRPYVDTHPTNFGQASDTWEKEMKEDERRRFVTNLVTSLSGAADFIKERAVTWFTEVNHEFAKRVAYGLKNASNYANHH